MGTMLFNIYVSIIMLITLHAILTKIASVDLGISEFSQPICHVLSGNISFLSKQKFSSNVIEKVSKHNCSLDGLDF